METKFIEVQPDAFNYSPFKLINKDWFQITCKANGRVNTMTASWASLGEMWNKTAAFIFIRPQRFTKTLVDATDYLSLQVLPSSLRKTSAYFGKATGFEEDKIKASGLNVIEDDNFAYFEESDVVFLCKKMFAQELTEKSFIDPTIMDKWYEQKDLHTMYVVEIEKILVSPDFHAKLVK